jgi:hypothetical protein
MACKCAPALVTLRAELNTMFPDRDKASDGCCGDAAHAARKSDHNPTDGYAHALDIDENVAPGRDLVWLWDAWRANPDPRIKYLIYEAQIVHPNSTIDRRPKAYTGPNAHRHHMHVSIVSTATHDTRRWLSRIGLEEPPPPTPTPSPLPGPAHFEEDTVQYAFVELAPKGYGIWEGWWNPGLGNDPLIVGVTLHGPSIDVDGPWPWSLGATVRAQARGSEIYVVAAQQAGAPAPPGERLHAHVAAAPR